MKKIITLALMLFALQTQAQTTVTIDTNGIYHPVYETVCKQKLLVNCKDTHTLYMDCTDYYKVYETEDNKLFILKRKGWMNRIKREWLVIDYPLCGR